MTACVTRLVTRKVCILGVVILERDRLYQNVGSNGRVQWLYELIVKHIRCKLDIKNSVTFRVFCNKDFNLFIGSLLGAER